jgi:hypothetical protein
MTKGEQARREIVERQRRCLTRKAIDGAQGGIYRHFSGEEALATEAFDYAWGKPPRAGSRK